MFSTIELHVSQISSGYLDFNATITLKPMSSPTTREEGVFLCVFSLYDVITKIVFHFICSLFLYKQYLREIML